MRLVVIAALLVFAASTAHGQEQPRLDLATRVSAEKSVAYLIAHVCLPVIIDGQPVEAAVNNRDIQPMSLARANIKDGAAQDRTWMLNGTAQAQVTLWADGTCMVGSRRGDPAKLVAATLDVLKARAEGFSPGTSQPDGDAIRTEYCSAATAHPYVVSIKVPAPKSKRAPFLANIFRSKADGRPPYCTVGP
jgi:hypothetical protein